MADVMTDTPTQHVMNTSTTHANMATPENACLLLTQDAMQPEIKSEPAEDITDCIGYDDSTNSNEALTCNSTDTTPKIRLTPTSKLLASPTPLDPKRKYICPYKDCTKSYGKSSHLRSHLTWHTGIKPFVCKEPSCGKGFTRSDELNRHMRTHTGEKPFECVQCSKKFSRSDHLTKHLGTHAKQMQNAKTKTEKAATNNKKPAPMDIVVSPDIDVGLHFMATANEQHEKSAEKSKVILKKGNRKNTRSKAEKQIHNAHEQRDDVIVPDDANKLPMVPVKTELITSNDNVQRHLNNASFTDAGVMLPADMQDIADIKPIPLIKVKTELAYSNERPHQCPECLRAFKRTDDLNRHLRTHTGQKPYPCTECEKRFLRSDHLKKHLTTHFKKELAADKCLG